MEALVILLVLFLIWLVAAPIIAMQKAGDAKKEAQQIRDELKNAFSRIKALELKLQQTPSRAEPVVSPPPVGNPALEAVLERIKHEPIEAPAPPPVPERRKLVDYGDSKKPESPPPVPAVPAEPFSLEKFLGVKLFAWLGGVAMFFGVILFVKYAFENNLISPALRISLGFVTGAALLIGGLVMHRLERYRVLAQAFCATGVLILYGVSFAAHAVYRFPAFGTLTTFGLMAGITFAAFFIAVRLNALVVAVLGMLGGFMTPLLLSTGQDQLIGLFGYIALLDIGLLAVSRHGRWRYLTSYAALGTALMMAGWFLQFFEKGRYFEGHATLMPMGILLLFIVLFQAGGWIGRRRPSIHAAASVLGLAAVAMVFSFLMLDQAPVAARYMLLYGFVLLVSLAVIVTVISRPRLGLAQVILAGLTFLHLALWTSAFLTEGNLLPTLSLYFVFGALHAIVPVVLQRRGAAAEATVRAGPWIGPVVLLMLLIPLLELSPAPTGIWVAILMANLLMIALALVTRAVVPVLLSSILTLGIAAIWLINIPANDDSLFRLLMILTVFPLVFVMGGLRLKRSATGNDALAASALPALSALLPFALLILAIFRLPMTNPSPVFSVALLMALLLAGLAVFGKKGILVLAALAGTLAVQSAWHAHHFRESAPMPGLAWHLGFYALFLGLPFAFRKSFAHQASPWIASALSGVGHFLLIQDLLKRSFPNEFPGLVPAAFAVPALLAVVAVLRLFPGMDLTQRSRLAWFGGVALLFITLIFPIQFERQWITVSWAIEGALLLWLFRRVPHPGLQLTGLALLAISFTRLTFNYAVFLDYPRSGTAILNWHLYVYGLVAAAHFLGARWFTDPSNRCQPLHPRGLLQAMGGLLLFLLLNIEIADFFTPPGDRCVSFRFGGNFARDMTTSIAWGLFSLALLGIGFRSGSRHARFAAVGLLVLTLLKVFLHDLAAIQNIFRIGALIGVAVIAFAASFLYQRFFDRAR